MNDEVENYTGWTEIIPNIPLKGFRTYVAFTYIGFNIVGFAVNAWVLYVVAPLLFAPAVKVPKSILFFIFALCVGDLTTMIAMFLLIIDVIFGTWQFSNVVCTSYLVFDSMNKFVAPMIVFLISRTCYTTICLEKSREASASLRYAIVQVIIALVFVMLLLWPVFAYSEVFPIYMQANNETREVTVIRKCGFSPPPDIQWWFNLIACFTAYAVPLCGIIYWYVSVPFFLRRRALTTLVSSSSMDAALKKVITTVLLLTIIYVLCWTPYWFFMFAHGVLVLDQKSMIIIFYFIHILPYISCVAYPLIFTLLNRGIRSAHAKIVQSQRRRLRSLTDEAGSQIRSVIRNLPSRASSSMRERINSILSDEKVRPSKDDDFIPSCKPTLLSPNLYLTNGRCDDYTPTAKSSSLSSAENFESETLL